MVFIGIGIRENCEDHLRLSWYLLHIWIGNIPQNHFE